jgi:hypothetical protein
MKVWELIPESVPIPVPVTFIKTKPGASFKLWGNYEFDWMRLEIFRKEHLDEEVLEYRLRPRLPVDDEIVRRLKL